MNRLSWIAVTLSIVGLGWLGFALNKETQKSTQSSVAWDKERADLQKRIWELKQRNDELESRPAPAPATATVAAIEPDLDAPRAEALPGPPRPRDRNGADRFEAMMSNPETQKLIALQQKSALDGRYAALFKQMNLSPADLDKFKNLLVEKQSSMMDVMAAARAQGLNPRENREEIKQLVQHAQNEVDNSIRATLGDAVYAQYQNYEATSSQRAVVSQLDQRLSYSATPLTDSQSQQLVQILAQTGKSKNNDRAAIGGPNRFVGTGGGATTITAEAVTQAQGILSSSQLSALQSLQHEQQASAQLKREMQTNFKK